MRLVVRTLVVAALLGPALGCAARRPVIPANDDPRWVASTSTPGVYRLDLLGSPSREGPFRYLLRIPAGLSVPAHRHSGVLRATLLSGAQVVVLGDPAAGPTATVRLRIGRAFLTPADVSHAETWAVASVLQVEGTGPLRSY